MLSSSDNYSYSCRGASTQPKMMALRSVTNVAFLLMLSVPFTLTNRVDVVEDSDYESGVDDVVEAQPTGYSVQANTSNVPREVHVADEEDQSDDADFSNQSLLAAIVDFEHAQARRWVLGTEGKSCDDACESIGKTCDSVALTASGGTQQETRDIARQLSVTCKSDIVETSSAVNPAQCTADFCSTRKGRCSYGKTGTGSCAAATWGLSRFCPCVLTIYERGGAGQDDCPSTAKVRVTSEHECKNAVAERLKKEYKGASCYGMRKKGCLASGAYLYFNTCNEETTAAPWGPYRPVCKFA